MKIFESILGGQSTKFVGSGKFFGRTEAVGSTLKEGEFIFTDEHKGDQPIFEDVSAPFLIKQTGETKTAKGAKIVSIPREETTAILTESKIDNIQALVQKEEKKPAQEEIFPFPQKGDVFQDAISGDRIVVEGIDRRDGELGVSYRETYASGKSKGEGKIFWKIPKSFYVMVDTKEMQKNDPLKESNPEFYVTYEEQMKKLESTFSWEIEAITDALNEWSDSFDEETDKERYNALVDRHSQLFEQLEEISKEGLRIKDSLFVARGLEEIKLFLKLRSFLLDERIPEDIRTDLIELRKENIDYEPNVELVERGYQTILLEKKKEAVEKRYNKLVDSDTVVAQDMPALNAFLKRINTLYLSVNEKSSSEAIKNVLSGISAIEEQMFAKKKGQIDKSEMNESGSVGGLVKGKTSRKQTYKEKIKENEVGSKKYIRPTSAKRVVVDENRRKSSSLTYENGVELNGDTNNMASAEIPVQEKDHIKTSDVNGAVQNENGADLSWRAELDKFQEYPEGLKAVEKLKEMLIAEWGIFEQKLLEEAQKRDIRIFRDESAKVWKDSFLKQLREMAIEYLDRYQSVPIKNGRNIFNAIVRTLEEENGEDEIRIKTKNRISQPVQEMSADLLKEMIDFMLVRVKNHLDLNTKREKPVVVKQEQEKEELSKEKQFAILVEALRNKRKSFGKDKNGKKLLIERKNISNTEIIYSYGGQMVSMKPKNVEKFLQFLDANFSWTPGALQEKRAVSPEEVEARGIMNQVDDVIQKKRGLAKDILEHSMNVEKVSEEGYGNFLEYLDDLGHGAKYFFKEGDIKGLQSILEKTRGAEFKLEKSEDKKLIITDLPEQREPGERTYENLYQMLGSNRMEISFEEERLRGSIAAGLQNIKEKIKGVDIAIFVSENKEDLTQAFSQSIMVRLNQFPWTVAEKKSFAKSFVEKYFEDHIK